MQHKYLSMQAESRETLDKSSDMGEDETLDEVEQRQDDSPVTSKMDTVPEDMSGETSTAKKFNPFNKHALALLDQKLPFKHQFEKS